MTGVLLTMARRYLNCLNGVLSYIIVMSDLIFYFCQARFPFLDEDVIRILLDIPLWEIADLDQPIGIGDKKILREVRFTFEFILERVLKLY